MEGLDSIGKRYGRLPSEVLRVRDPMRAICIDLWAHNWGVQKDAHDIREANRRGGPRGRRGGR